MTAAGGARREGGEGRVAVEPSGVKDELTLQKALPGEEDAVADLVRSVFYTFVAPELSRAGIDEFLGFITPCAIRKRLGSGTSCIFTARHHGMIVGVVEMRYHRHISLLFVQGSFQRQGVARRLLETALREEGRSRDISVNAAPDAVAVYERLGFCATGYEQETNGVRHVPMLLQR